MRAPDYTLSFSATYHAHVGPVELSPTFGYNYSSDYAIGTTGSPASTNGTWTKAQAYIDAGLTLKIDSLPGLVVSAECRNCADKAYPMSALGPFQYVDWPGSWGVRARYSF